VNDNANPPYEAGKEKRTRLGPLKSGVQISTNT
jgi:hypothetical protein